MTAPRGDSSTAAVRGGAVGASVAVLAVAAHGAAGGGLPDSTEGAFVLLAAVLAGALVAALPANRLAVFGLLAAGQGAAHTVLGGLVGHGHAETDGPPGLWMTFAHAVATVVCGALILLTHRLYAVITTALRAATTHPRVDPLPRLAAPVPAGFALPSLSPNGAIGPRAPPAFR
ncbi:hypothetical protein ACWEKT_04760 [Nocardia takedensis]